jgi:hypothetical protein
MVHKLALAVGGLAAASILAVALGAAGFTPGAAASKTLSTTSPVTAAQTKTVTDTVYVAPTPAPRVIHVTKPAAAPPRRPHVVTIVRSPHRGEGDDAGDRHEHEGGD